MKRLKWKQAVVAVLTGLMVLGSCISAQAKEELAQVDGLWWDDEVANWEEVEDAYQYELMLYRGAVKQETFKTKKLKYSLVSKITRTGNYRYKVRALARGTEFEDGPWSEYSEVLEVDSDYLDLIKQRKSNTTTNTETTPTSGGPGAVKQPEQTPGATTNWRQDANGWWYQRNDGTYPAQQWMQDPATGRWYFFGPTGYMVTGWIDWNGAAYYCGADGSMVTGDQVIGGIQYRFDASGAFIQ